jgi:hypothetical protein
VIYAEGLSALLQDAEANGKITGIKICPAAPPVTHLFFADDSVLLIKANVMDARALREILELYENCSGQCINTEKSAIMFSKNSKQHHKVSVKNALAIQRDAWNEKYLGLPVYVGRSKKKAFEYLKEKIWARIQGWIEKLLSKAGKEVLIKAVAQAIPTYAMSCFYLTKGFCDEISSMIAKFWWSQQDKSNKIHWVGWETLTKPKSMGGLGFRDIHNFNIAMLSRQAWRLVQQPESLCAQILRARYYPDGDVLKAGR